MNVTGLREVNAMSPSSAATNVRASANPNPVPLADTPRSKGSSCSFNRMTPRVSTTSITADVPDWRNRISTSPRPWIRQFSISVASTWLCPLRLAQAMYRSEVLDGFDIRQSVLEPVTVGKLEVQQVGEYRGADLKGLILRVRNSGRDAQVLNENMLAARGAVAFMTPVSELAAGQETAVYLIQANGGR